MVLTLTTQEFIRKIRDRRAKPAAILTGLAKAGPTSNAIAFSLLGRDSWVMIPRDMITRVDIIDQIRHKENSIDQVRIHLTADDAKQISDLLRQIHSIPTTVVGRPDDGTSFRIHPFGLFGWNELRDNVTLAGTALDHNYSGDHPFGDGDWNLKVRPDPAYAHLLVNSHGQSNEDGIVECEICPIDADGGGDREARYFSRLQGKHVVVNGTWSEDKSHDDKTEIHPITSIYCRDGEFLHIFVFTDDSANFPAHVPHSKENRVANIRYDLTRGEKFYIAEERDHSRSQNVRIVDDASGYYIKADIQSGTPDEGRGFYYAKLSIAMGLPPNPQLPNPPHGQYLKVTFRDGNDERNGLIELTSDTNAYGYKAIPPNASAQYIAVLCSTLATDLKITNWRHPTLPVVYLYGHSIWIRCDPGVFDLDEGEL